MVNLQTPGNYPADFKLGRPVENERIVVISDIRRFTSCLEKHQRKTILFISEFFDEMAGLIQTKFSDAYVNKYLGDGMLAHFPPGPDYDQAALSAIQAAFSSLDIFREYLKKYEIMEKDIGLMGLSIVLSKESIYRGIIGKCSYLDYTLVGKHVNRVFRALDSSKGNLVLIFENLKDRVEDKYILVDIGLQTYDGVYVPVELYSVMRDREDDETGGKLRTCMSQCLGYKFCKAAFDQGRKKQDFLNCQDCKECWHWYQCEIKQRYGVEHNGHDKFQCCHICSNFTKCFHNYYLGKSFSSYMIWCGDNFPYKLI